MAEVNGQLSSMKKMLCRHGKEKYSSQKCICTKVKVLPTKNKRKGKIDNRRSDITPDFEFDEIDNDELVSACVEAEGAEENKVQNVEIVYQRTGCNRWENMCSMILM